MHHQNRVLLLVTQRRSWICLVGGVICIRNLMNVLAVIVMAIEVSQVVTRTFRAYHILLLRPQPCRH